MLKIDRKAKTFTSMLTPSLSEAAISERYDLQEYICNSPEAFFDELGRQLFYVAKEVVPSDDVQDRIDILAVDREGSAVVIELKRGNYKFQVLQAISYAGMISKWEPNDFLTLLTAERQESLAEFLDVDVEEINRRQKIILVAEAFDYSALVSAEWLSERHRVDIVCCRLALATDKATQSEYLVCSNVYPAPELVQQAVKRSHAATAVSAPKWDNWDKALVDITNPQVADFFKQRVAAGQEQYLRKRILRFRIHGKRRWMVAARKKLAYVWQHGRFQGDVEFWQKLVADKNSVSPVKDGECLRFFLSTKQDFEAFFKATENEMKAVEWTNAAAGVDDDLDEAERLATTV
jgi:hypothetical protein